MRAALAALAALVALAGCGSLENVTRGGKVVGDTLTVYTLLPQPGEGNARDVVDAVKLGLYEAGGTAGEFAVNYVSVDENAPAVQLRESIADPQVTALIGPFGSETAMTVVPLFNEAGILQVTPGAGYAGFTEVVRPGEPERWQPSGRRTLARLVGDDLAQSRALLAAAGAASGKERPRVAIEQEPGPVADALVAALQEAGARTVGAPTRADAVIYAGDDAHNAAGVGDALAGEAPGTPVVYPDALTFAGVEQRLGPAARRRAVLVSSAPEPGSTPRLRDFERRFRARYDRPPGPYGAVGYEAIRSVLAAIAAAGNRAGYRQEVIDAYFADADRPDSVTGPYRLQPDGRRAPAPFTATRPGRGSLGSN